MVLRNLMIRMENQKIDKGSTDSPGVPYSRKPRVEIIEPSHSILFREYSEAMWKWVEKTLKSSEEFDFLFVAGHYMLLDEFHFRWLNI